MHTDSRTLAILWIKLQVAWLTVYRTRPTDRHARPVLRSVLSPIAGMKSETEILPDGVLPTVGAVWLSGARCLDGAAAVPGGSGITREVTG